MAQTFKTPKEKELSFEEVVDRYERTPKKVSINIQKVKPNYYLCKLLKLHKAVEGVDGKSLILPDAMGGSDEVILEIVSKGTVINQDILDLEVGDQIIVKDASPIIFKPSTKLACENKESAVFHLVNGYDILGKVEYSKV